MVELKLPDWFRVLDPPESPWDPCRLVLHDVGPNRRKVEEVVQTWCRMRQWPPVDLDQMPVVVAPEIQRLAALLMRKSLAEIDARGEIECLRPGEGAG